MTGMRVAIRGSPVVHADETGWRQNGHNKNALSSLVNKVYHKETRVLVKKRGIPVAAIISAPAIQAS